MPRRLLLGWFRTHSVQELVGLDITYNQGTADQGGSKQLGDEDVKEEYLDAYERYRQNMRNARVKTNKDPARENE